jgi:hypothetical protein
MTSFSAPVAQLDRALPSEGRGHKFESCRARHLFKELACAVRSAHPSGKHRVSRRKNFGTMRIAFGREATRAATITSYRSVIEHAV